MKARMYSGRTLSLAALLGAALSAPGFAQCQIDALVGSANPLGVSDSPYSLAVSGDTLAVGYGAHMDWPAGPGAYVFVRSGSGWLEQANLSGPASWGSLEACSLALEGDTLVFVDGVFGNQTYVYTRSGTAWSAAATLTTASEYSGNSSVAISGNTIAVGMPEDGPYDREGQVYVFVGGGTSWSLEATLLPSDPEDASFGAAVALDGDRLFVLLEVGAASAVDGAVFEFQRSGSIWSEVEKIDPPAGSRFGGHLALDGSSLAVGSVGKYPLPGEVHLFTPEGGTWVHEATLAPFGASTSFGSSLGLRGDRLVVGDGRNDHLTDDTGVAYVFERSAGTWMERDRLYGDDVGIYDFFGSAVVFTDDGEIAATTDGHFVGDNGKVYVFNEDPGCPTAAFAAAPASGVTPLAVDFQDLSTGATGGPVWDFGDGSPVVSDLHDVSHVYETPGTFDVSLTVGNEVGIDRYIALDSIDVQLSAKAVVRNGTGVNPPCFASTSLPIVGTTWTCETDAAFHPGGVLSFLVIAAQPFTGSSAFGELLVYKPVYVIDVVLVAAGIGHHAIPVPPNPELVGLWVYTQGAVADSFAALCNAVDLQFGY